MERATGGIFGQEGSDLIHGALCISETVTHPGPSEPHEHTALSNWA